MSITQSLPNLPPAIARHTLYLLTEALPPPISDIPEERAARDAEAIAAVVVLKPADAFEARLAVRVVAADAHAIDSLRTASLPGCQMEDVRRCRAQAAAMMRASQGALHALLAIQAARTKAQRQLEPAVDESPPRDIAAEADEYAVHHRKRAALIRSLGRLPHRLDWGPMKPELVQAIISGTSPILRGLDRAKGDRLAMAA